MLIRYWASATESGLPVMVIVRSVLPLSRSSQLEMRIMAPEIWRISAILVPPLPIMQPIRSFGTVISWDWDWTGATLRLLLVRSWEPANAARAAWGIYSRALALVQYSGRKVIVEGVEEVEVQLWGIWCYRKCGTGKKIRLEYLPVGLSPPVLEGIAPASPSAASPASGFLAIPET